MKHSFEFVNCTDKICDEEWISLGHTVSICLWIDKISVILTSLKGHQIYEKKCKSCHGKNMNGKYLSEFSGDDYIPSLNGISVLERFQNLKNQTH